MDGRSGAAKQATLSRRRPRAAPPLFRSLREVRERRALAPAAEDSERRAQRQTARLEALWRIVNAPSPRGEDFLVLMLREAADAMRPGHVFAGTLGHVEGDSFVLDAVSTGAAGDFARRFLGLGSRIAMRDTLLGYNLEAGRTQSWQDCQALADLPSVPRDAGLRSQIATHFTANGVTYILSIASREAPSPVPFDADDNEYIEVLGSIFARHLELKQMEGSLGDAEIRSRQHADRLEALWQIANNPDLRPNDMVSAMLDQGAHAMRPDQRFVGVLGRIEGDEVVVVSVGAGDAGDPRANLVAVGTRRALSETLIPRVVRTHAWDDLGPLRGAFPWLKRLGWQSAIATRFEAGGQPYSLAFASVERTTRPFGAEDAGYIELLAAAFSRELQVTELKGSLRDEQDHSRQRADRLEALWKIVNNPNLHGDELVIAMLRQSAASIRPGQDYRGVLWRVAGTDVVVEAVAASAGMSARFDAVGATIPLDETVVGTFILHGGGTRAWDDLESSPDATPLSRMHATRSFLCTMFTAGDSTWVLSFASKERTRSPLGHQDYTYLEVLASFFANHLQQRWQFEQLEYQQSHDVLTGLVNRSEFRSQVRAVARARPSYAVILVDIDAFREVNESQGQSVGDAVLMRAAKALCERASPHDIVGRIAGDVFGVCIADPFSPDDLLARATEFQRAFVEPSASVGLAFAPDHGSSIDTVIAHANAALSVAKQRGAGSLVCYEPGMEGETQRRAALRNELSEAVAQDQFVLYYQPHVDISTGNVIGCEALIRWNHPTKGLLLPGTFIPFAEECGIITRIDDWVMRNAFAAAAELSALRPDFRLYFNLSGRQAGDAKLIRSFVRAARDGVALRNIGVELTETDAMRDVEATRFVCRALRRLNVRIAIDDFGTGYSSLSSLKRLPIDIVKIDRSFVSGILMDPHDQAITEAIISIAERFGYRSLAEGVEQTEEIGWLLRHGCNFAQGFAICRPLPIAEFVCWLGERAWAAVASPV